MTNRTHLRPSELARARGVKSDTILALIRSGQLKAVNMSTQPNGRPRWLIPREAVEAFDAARSSVAKQRPRIQRVRRRRPGDVVEFF